jgi:hypothetical protein
MQGLENIIKTTEQAHWNDIIFWLLSRYENKNLRLRNNNVTKNMFVGFKWCQYNRDIMYF